MFRKCCVPKCDSQRQDVKLHRFPVREDAREKWLKCINCEKLCTDRMFTAVNRVFVCHKHFERRFISATNRLKIGAYPTLFSDSEIASGNPISSRITESAQTEMPPSSIGGHDHQYAKKRHCRSTSADMEADSISNMDMDIDEYCEEITIQEKPAVPPLYLLELEEDVALQQPVTAPQQPVTTPQTTNACCQYSKFLEQYEKFNLEPNEKNSSTEHQVKVLKHDNIVYQKRICVLLSTQEKLKLRIKQLEAKLLAESEDFITKVKRVFADVFTSNQVDMVLGDRTQVHWTDVEYAKAYKLHRLSENAYFYMRDKMNYPLPNTSPLLKWASKLFGDRANDDDDGEDDDEEEPPMPKPIKLVLEEIKDEYDSDEKNNGTDCVSEGNMLHKKSKDTSDTKRKSEAVNEDSDSDQSQMKIRIDTKNTDENDEQDSDIYEEIDYIDDIDIVEDNNDVDEHNTTIATSGTKITDENYEQDSDVYEQIDYIDDEDYHDVDEHIPTSADESRTCVSKIVYYNKDSEKVSAVNDNDSDIVDNDNRSEKHDEYFKEFVG